MTDNRLFKLINQLNHEDASLRRLAAEELAKADERAIYPLIKALRDESPGVQDAAIQSLISIGGEVTAYMVTPLLRDENPLIRNSAFIILRSLGQRSITFLYSLLRDKDEDIRKFALDLLGEIKEGVLSEKIISLLKDSNPNVRASAAKTLGIIGQKECLPYLIEALDDEEWVAFSAIESLGRIGDETALHELSRILSSGSESLRFIAIDAIGRIGTDAAKSILKEYLGRSEGIEKEIVIKTLLNLDTLPEGDGIEKLITRLFIESEWDDRLLYLKGLVMLRHFDAIGAIIDITGSVDPSMPDSEEIIDKVKEGLKELGCSDSLINVIKDPKFRFRGKVIAIDVIGDLKCHRAVPFLIELLKTDLRDVRRASIKAIGNMDSEDTIDTLIETTDDYDSHVRKAAISALGRIGAKEAFEPILQTLQKEIYEDVFEEAVKALLRIDKERLLSTKDLRPEIFERINNIVGERI